MVKQDCSVSHYFVDEAGDPVLFGKGGRVLVGQNGCSRCFMLGVAMVANPRNLGIRLTNLRKKLSADEYLKSIPSMHPSEKKTSMCFHAKDDCPEVRREVYRLLRGLGQEIAVFAIIRRKKVLVDIGLEARRLGTKAAIGANDLYDGLVTKLFSIGTLTLSDHHNITFARRGDRHRIEALAKAIEQAKTRGKKLGFEAKPCSVTAKFPSDCPCLQVVDYYLWAIQRLYERQEHRYFDYVKDQIRIILDPDDTAEHPNGEVYIGDMKPTLERIGAL